MPELEQAILPGTVARRAEPVVRTAAPTLWDRRRVTPQLHAARLRWIGTCSTLIVTDLLAISISVLAAAVVLYLIGVSIALAPVFHILLAVGVGHIVGSCAVGIVPGVGINPIVETRKLALIASVVFAIVAVSRASSPANMQATASIALAWLLVICALPAGRMCCRHFFGRFQWWKQPIVVLGECEVSRRLARRLRALPSIGLEPIGHLGDYHRHWQGADSDGGDYLGPTEMAAELIATRGVQWAIVPASTSDADSLRDLLAAAQLFPHVLYVDENPAGPTLWRRPFDIDGCSGCHGFGGVAWSVPRGVKRAFDMLIAGVLVILLAPVLFAIALTIRLSSRGRALYWQQRIGRDGRPFKTWKFRTMHANADDLLRQYLAAHPELLTEWEQDHKLKNDPRIIPGIGTFLRKYSLDELPQLLNVLLGDMSLVGPRPIVEAEIPKYAASFELYKQVSPGLTGLWQISGRNNTTYQRRVFLDSYYVQNWSIWMDLYILLRTVKTVLLREGAY